MPVDWFTWLTVVIALLDLGMRTHEEYDRMVLRRQALADEKKDERIAELEAEVKRLKRRNRNRNRNRARHPPARAEQEGN